MSRKQEYFRKFLENPSAYRNRAFWRMAKQWGKYILAHKDEFNYLEDDEWKEIRERLIADFERRDDIRDEFDELDEELDAVMEGDDAKRIEVRQRWLAFMKRNQFDYNFTDEQINETEAAFEKYARSVKECEIAEEKLRISKADYQLSVEDLDNSLAEHYERTGKIPVLTALPSRKKYNGN